MKNYLVPISVIVILTLLIANLLISEIKDKNKIDENNYPEQVSEDIVTEEQIYGQDIVVLMSKNTDKKELEMRLLSGGRPQKLKYDGTTSIINRYDSQIVASQLECGGIYKIEFSKRDRMIRSMEEYDDAFIYTDVNKIDIDERKGIVAFNNLQYQYDENLQIFSGDEKGDMIDITDMDSFTVRGYGHTVYSIVIEKGHGYLRLTNEAYFVNGWIEVGNDIIKPITEDMLIPVPEGTYNVTVRNRGYAGSKEVKIERDKEKKLDLSDIEVKEVAIGHVLFTLSPVYAQLYIDNEVTDYDERVPVEYGVHDIRIEAAGYIPVHTSIKVLNDYADIKISLEEDPNADSTSSSSTNTKAPNTTAGSSSTDRPLSTTINGLVYSLENASSSAVPPVTVNTSSSSTMDYDEAVSDVEKIYVDGPNGAEVYLDGSYIGIAPTSTPKVTGSHEITLTKSGYQTKKYTISVDNDGKNVTYSFSELIEE